MLKCTKCGYITENDNLIYCDKCGNKNLTHIIATNGKPLDFLLCPNPVCDYEGKFKKESQFNLLLAIILFLFWIVPGVIYCVLSRKCVYICPRCGTEVCINKLALKQIISQKK